MDLPIAIPSRVFLIVALRVNIHDRKIATSLIIINLIPNVAGCRDGEEVAKKPVNPGCNDEADEEVDVVDVSGADRDGFSDCAHEANHVDEDATDVGGVSPPGPTEPVEVRVLSASAVESLDIEISLTDEVVVADHDAGDGG